MSDCIFLILKFTFSQALRLLKLEQCTNVLGFSYYSNQQIFNSVKILNFQFFRFNYVNNLKALIFPHLLIEVNQIFFVKIESLRILSPFWLFSINSQNFWNLWRFSINNFFIAFNFFTIPCFINDWYLSSSSKQPFYIFQYLNLVVHLSAVIFLLRLMSLLYILSFQVQILN